MKESRHSAPARHYKGAWANQRAIPALPSRAVGYDGVAFNTIIPGRLERSDVGRSPPPNPPVTLRVAHIAGKGGARGCTVPYVHGGN